MLAVLFVLGDHSHVIRPPQVSLASVPTQIGTWTAEPVQLSDDVFAVLKAEDDAGFLFRNSSGQTASVHMATWIDPQMVGEVCPHHPTVCYANNGWETLDTQQFAIDVDGIGEVPVEAMLLTLDGRRICVAYTYEIGPHHFYDQTGARMAQVRLLNESVWPPVTKFMVQTELSEISQARPVITDLLSAILKWHADENRDAELSKQTEGLQIETTST